jgi:hypothetical protein
MEWGSSKEAQGPAGFLLCNFIICASETSRPRTRVSNRKQSAKAFCAQLLWGPGDFHLRKTEVPRGVTDWKWDSRMARLCPRWFPPYVGLRPLQRIHMEHLPPSCLTTHSGNFSIVGKHKFFPFFLCAPHFSVSESAYLSISFPHNPTEICKQAWTLPLHRLKELAKVCLAGSLQWDLRFSDSRLLFNAH